MAQTKSNTSYNRKLFESVSPDVADAWELAAEAPFLNILPVGEDITSRTHSWVEDVAYSFSTALSAGVSAGATTWNVTSGSGNYFTVGDMVLASSEIVRVTAINSDALTVDRAEQGTSAAAHTTTDTIYIIGNAALEGAESPTGSYTTRTTKTNYTQIFRTPVKITGTDLVVSGPGGDEATYQKSRHEKMHYTLLDRALCENKAAATGSASASRYMNGLKGFLSSYTYAITSSTIGGTTASTAITKTRLDTFLRLRKTEGGKSWVCFCGLTAYGAIQDMFAANDQSPISQNGAEAGTFGFIYTSYLCAYGTVTFVLNRNMQTGDAVFLEWSDARLTGAIMRFLRRPKYVELAVTGDYEKGEWITEMTLEMRNPQCSGIITGIVSGA